MLVAAAGLGRAEEKSDIMSFFPFAPDEAVEVVGEVALVEEGEGSCQSRSKIPPPPPPPLLVLAAGADTVGAAAVGACFVADADAGGRAELGSSRRSMAVGAFFTGAAAGAACFVVVGAVEAELPSPSNVLGSLGGGPSIAHLLLSYLLLIKLSIL